MKTKLKILNLYAGIGGNRKSWGNSHDITAIEIDPKIAKIYKDFFPNDKVIVKDAHKYLLKHFKEFDFIWSSPPCPTHSRVRKNCAMNRIDIALPKAKFPDMKLYEEILFLEGYFKGKYCIENVVSWYKPLIVPQERQRHYFWANFYIDQIKLDPDHICGGSIDFFQKNFGFDLSKYKSINKKLALTNCVNYELGEHILNCALKGAKQQIFEALRGYVRPQNYQADLLPTL